MPTARCVLPRPRGPERRRSSSIEQAAAGALAAVRSRIARHRTCSADARSGTFRGSAPRLRRAVEQDPRGGALVIPAGLLAKLRAQPLPASFTADAAARAEIEGRAMAAVMAAEQARGHVVTDVPGKMGLGHHFATANRGWRVARIAPH